MRRRSTGLRARRVRTSGGRLFASSPEMPTRALPPDRLQASFHYFEFVPLHAPVRSGDAEANGRSARRQGIPRCVATCHAPGGNWRSSPVTIHQTELSLPPGSSLLALIAGCLARRGMGMESSSQVFRARLSPRTIPMTAARRSNWDAAFFYDKRMSVNGNNLAQAATVRSWLSLMDVRVGRRDRTSSPHAAA